MQSWLLQVVEVLMLQNVDKNCRAEPIEEENPWDTSVKSQQNAEQSRSAHSPLVRK
jgi:hypothetical protein